MDARLKLITGDITKIEVDAIVNAANSSLLGGGGVDGAIHRGAGPELLEACRLIGGCNTGQAKVTKGYNLPCKYIIHTVGPIWNPFDYYSKKSYFDFSEEKIEIPKKTEAEYEEDKRLLRNAYASCMKLAHDLKCKTIAFPNISTGVYGFPKDLAAEIALSEVSRWLDYGDRIDTVYFVCFDQENFDIYENQLTLF